MHSVCTLSHAHSSSSTSASATHCLIMGQCSHTHTDTHTLSVFLKCNPSLWLSCFLSSSSLFPRCAFFVGEIDKPAQGLLQRGGRKAVSVGISLEGVYVIDTKEKVRIILYCMVLCVDALLKGVMLFHTMKSHNVI